jgi:hypothetical protein
MLTERFHRLRKEELDQAFSKRNIAKVWRETVKDQLRRADIQDIYDYYDFNYNIDERALLLRNDLLNGNYQCSFPLIYKAEKKLGVCRHLVLPQPLDALILQVITEELSLEIIKRQPSENSFYSQDKHSVHKPHEIDEYGFSWRDLWKKMQRKIYKFNTEKELIVVSDLTNYYDSIDIVELRKKITSCVSDKEVLIDLLFKVVEKISWLPDYLPYTGRGLPTTNLEGIRLLAHCFLFELDYIIKEKTSNSFTRWMDDLIIGVDSKEEGIETLSSSSDILKSRGLALNLAKTYIYDSVEAESNFLITENKYLDSVKTTGLSKPEKKIVLKDLKKRFKNHVLNNKSAKYSEKVSKRYITLFGKLHSDHILKDLTALYEGYPELRKNLMYYLTTLGYNKETSKTVETIMSSLKIYDDISLFNICQLLTSWDIKTDEDGDTFIKLITDKIHIISSKRKTAFDFYCLLWIKTKYEHPESLYNFIEKYENIWRTSPFLRRSVTAIMARLVPYKEEKVKAFLQRQISTGEPQVVSIANQILSFSSVRNVESKINMYLFPAKKPVNYPMQKFLVLCSILNSDTARKDIKLRKNVVEYINDSYFRKWLEFQYEIK